MPIIFRHIFQHVSKQYDPKYSRYWNKPKYLPKCDWSRHIGDQYWHIVEQWEKRLFGTVNQRNVPIDGNIKWKCRICVPQREKRWRCSQFWQTHMIWLLYYTMRFNGEILWWYHPEILYRQIQGYFTYFSRKLTIIYFFWQMVCHKDKLTHI